MPNTLNILIYIAVSALETYIFINFLDTFLYKKASTINFYPLFVFIFFTFQFCTYILNAKLLSSILPTYIISLLIAHIFYEEQLRYKLHTINILILLEYACRFFAAGIHSTIVNSNNTGALLPLLSPSTQIIACVSFLLMNNFLLFLRKLRIKGYNTAYELISSSVHILIIICIACYALFLKDISNNFRLFYYFNSVFFTSISLVAFFYLDKYHIIRDTMEVSQMANHLLEVEKNYTAKFLSREEEVQKFHHDIKKHLQNIYFLCNNNKYEAASEYISKLIDSPIVKTNIVLTKNYVIDSILQQNKATMEADGIEVKISTMLAENQPFDDIELSILLGNLLSNAQEACNRIQNNSVKKEVDIKIHQRKQFLYIEISNSFNGKLFKRDGTFLSSKRQNGSSGIGLQNVENIVDKYDGIMKLSNDKNIFTVKILLPYSTENVN